MFAGSPNYEGGSYIEALFLNSLDTQTFFSTPLSANVYNLSAEGAAIAEARPRSEITRLASL